MKKYTRFLDVPAGASYIGSTNEDGFLDDETAEYVDAAYEAACYVDGDGVTHYYDIG